GDLPNAPVSDLDMALGVINATTGRPKVAGSPDLLLATTYGRSSFAIRLAPVVVPGTLKLSGDVAGTAPLTFTGIGVMTNNGNKVRVSILDVTDPNNPVLLAGWNGTDIGTGSDVSGNWTNATGNFSLQINPSIFANGPRTIAVRLTDDAGVVGT